MPRIGALFTSCLPWLSRKKRTKKTRKEKSAATEPKVLRVTDIPVEVLLNHLLPVVPTQDLLRLGQVNRFFSSLVNDETFWKHRLAHDYNFTGSDTARAHGWKTIYRGLHHPRVMVWGEKGDGRLGSAQYPDTANGHVSAPAEITIPGARIISLAAGGMSFHALDSKGDVYVWGTLNATSRAPRSGGFAEAGKMSEVPLKLALPAPTRAISCGRLHAATLDTEGHIWNFMTWGLPFRITSPLLSNEEIVQIECGWAYTSALTKSGQVLVWFPFTGALEDQIFTHHDQNRDPVRPVRPSSHINGEATTGEEREGVDNGTMVIPCLPWECDAGVTMLPRLPQLPHLSETGSSGQGEEQELTQLVKIAAMDMFLLGLTNKGHVLKFGLLRDEHSTANGRWTYMPQFCDAAVIRQHPTFSPQSSGSNGQSSGLKPPESVKITHITAHYQRFVAYSTGSSSDSSVVLLGDYEMDSTIPATILPTLQYRGVITVLLGDWHYAALTESGEMLTWGEYCNGALGLGDPDTIEVGKPGGYGDERDRERARTDGSVSPPRVTTPTKVRFFTASPSSPVSSARKEGDTGEKKVFCFAGTASGWHTGALVIDLES